MTPQSRGLQGAVLKALGAEDFELTVTGRREISPHYLRLSFAAGGLLADRPVHPTMWIRIWFPKGGNKLHQRGYTLVDADPVADTFDIEFALHEGPAANWAVAAQPGDTIVANVMGTKFELPQPEPAGYLIVGDIASLPAANSLLSQTGTTPAQVWLEWTHDDDRDLPMVSGEHIQLTWVRRARGGADLTSAVRAAAFDAPDHFGFVACDTRTTRQVSSVLRNDFRLPRKSLKAQAYWMA